MMLASQAQATSERVCQSMASIAEAAADARDMGAKEKEILLVPESTWIKKGYPTAMETKTAASGKDVIRYVYTMQLKSVDARKLVYLKCIAGDFGIY